MQTGFCKYNRREEPLCKAHILPNALYRYLRKRGADGFWLNAIGSRKIKGIPGGFYDRNMLCGTADNQIGHYDKYWIILQKEEIPVTLVVYNQGREWARIENLDVQLMNLFLLSYFWRCHHAPIEAFQTFNIGPVYEERIRQKLVNQDGDSVRWFSYTITMNYFDINDFIQLLKFSFRKKIDRASFDFLHYSKFKIISKLYLRKNFDWFNIIVASPGKSIVMPRQPYRESNDYLMECQSLSRLLATGASW